MKKERDFRLLSIAIVVFAVCSVSPAIVVAHGPESIGTYITIKAVDLKEGPGQSYETVRKFRKGTTFEIVGKEKGWLKVQLSEHNLHFGYLEERFAVVREQLERISPRPAIPGAYIITVPIVVRRGPGENFAAISTLPKGTRIVVIGMDGDWLRIASKRGGPGSYVERKSTLLEHVD